MLYMDGIGYSNDNMFVGEYFSRTDDMVANIWNYMSCGVFFFFSGLVDYHWNRFNYTFQFVKSR